MDDTRSASLVLIVGAAGVAWWWYHLTAGTLSEGGPAQSNPAPPSDAKLPQGPTIVQGDYLARLEAFAAQWGLRITSGYRTPEQNRAIGGAEGSLHTEGRAIDVVGKLSAAARDAAAALGIHILQEGGPGGQYPSTGPHYHLSFPEMRNGRLVF